MHHNKQFHITLKNLLIKHKGGEKIIKQTTLSKNFIILLLIIFTILVCINAASAAGSSNSADNIYVALNGSDSNDGFSWDTPKLSIKNATGTVNTNGTINIANGSYSGVNNTGITINKNMNIIGESQAGTLINGEHTNRIFSILSDVNVTIQNLTLTNGTAISYGGAIVNDEGNLFIKSCTFINNTAYGAGAIYNKNNLTLENCNFIDNHADEGGAIFNEDNGKLTANNCSFTYNSAEIGGAIYNEGGFDYTSNLTMNNCNLISNAAEYGGGAIFTGGDLTLRNCELISNTATSGGAIVRLFGNLTADNCTFTNNTATGDGVNGKGGAIYHLIEDDTNLFNVLIKNCIFTSNRALDGGAINNFCQGDDSNTVENCNFINNSADGLAGAIYTGSALTVNNCNFSDNHAGDDGGAIQNFGILNANNCKFINNTGASGGAIYNGGHSNITGSTFVNNYAYNKGGAIFHFVDTLIANFCRFYNNTAVINGNAIFCEDGSVNVILNWWGSNNPDFTHIISKEDNAIVDYNPWLIMKYSANQTSIKQGETAILTADFRYDSAGNFHDPTLGHLPDKSSITFTTNLGNVGSKSIVIGTTNGISAATLRGDEAAGVAFTSASLDNQTLNAIVTITPTANAASTVTSTRTIAMQQTGLPIAGLILAILAVLGGLITPKRK